jgi:hypothetical protein
MARDHAPVALVAYRERQDAVDIAEGVGGFFRSRRVEVRRVFDHAAPEASPLEPGSLVVSLGGDVHLLEGRTYGSQRGLRDHGCEPLAELGFLLSVAPDPIAREIERARAGQLSLNDASPYAFRPADGITRSA